MFTRAADEDHGMIGSLGVITGRDMRGDRHLPFWLEQGIQSSLRDTEEDIPVVSFTALSSAQAQRSSQIASPAVLTPTEGTPPGGIRGGNKGPWTDLDRFYEDDDSEEDSSEHSEEEQDDSVEHEDKEEEDGEEEEDDEDESEEEEEEEWKGEDPRGI
jgi:AP-3 complex subunit beta